MGLKESFKLFVFPMIVSAVALMAFFIGGLRIGSRMQREIDEPMIEECVNQLVHTFESVEIDGGTLDAGTP